MGIRDRWYMRQRPDPEPEPKFEPFVLSEEYKQGINNLKARTRRITLIFLGALLLIFLVAVAWSILGGKH